MDVLVHQKGVDHRGVAGHMGQYPQFDLGVVRVDQQPAGTGHEGPPYGLAQLGANGYILQVRLGGADAPCGGAHLVKSGVDPAVFVPHRDQCVDIGRFQLLVFSIFQNLCADRIVLRQLLQHLGVGGNLLLRRGDAQLAEQQFTQLLWGIEVDPRPCHFSDLIGQALDLRPERDAQLPEYVRVHQEALVLHAPQHVGQRKLDPAVDLFKIVFL